MTTERIDHVAEAQMLYDAEFGSTPNSLGYDTADVQHLLNMLGAQVHATLALVEQQRIANLLAIANWVSPDHLGTKLDALRMGVAGEVWEGLGL